MEWTEDQKQAIFKKDSNILVAAAAGSGKTAVLVERIINKIVNEGIDIDRLLVVTFTNAAASEMRERILNSLYKKIDESTLRKEQEKLHKQIMLLNKASICTIDSFCLDVIRNNFFETDIAPNFRIGDSSEMELLKMEVLEELFEEKYEKHDEEFECLVRTYTSYRDDTPLKDLILKIYSYISSNPYPEKWLEEQVEKLNIENTNIDFSDTEWGKILIQEIKEELIDDIALLKSETKKISVEKELILYQKTIENDIVELETLYNNLDNWDKAYSISKTIEFLTWPRSKSSLIEKENAKKVRDNVKKKFKDKIDKIFVSNSEEAMNDIKEIYDILNSLKNLIFEFIQRFNDKKKEKNVLDFSDVEHKALEILVHENSNGTHVRSEIAKKYQEKFVEIAIDEYQDSNLVQEYILTAVSRENNIFMVGDVKQSIYKFRQAMPELFLKKYENYSLNKSNNEGLKIKLFKNFRSKNNIIDFTNIVFNSIMSKELGEIEYSKEEYLNLGSKWDESKVIKNEINIIDLKQDDKKESDFEKEEEQEEKIEDIELEAKFVAKKIQDLVQNNYQVYDVKKQEYRDIKYKDIVILLRSTKGKAPIYENELMNLGIPVYSDMSSVYIDSMEIQTILSLLKIIDNPMQDIPLVMVLRSNIGKFTDNELVEIRLAEKNSDFYTAMQKAKLCVSEKLRKKIEEFLNQISLWRDENEYLSLDELIWKIYEDTGFIEYVGNLPNGELRKANLKMLFERAKEYETASFKGLFNFIRFIEKLKLSNNELSAAKIIGENEDVVRIMSIHKSKGLEFPIVFLSSTKTKFNFMDLNEDILMNQELGLGVKYINYNKQVKYDTLTKLAIKNKELISILSEEMRILYVALTRAKEKIFITGISKDFQKSKEKIEELTNIYNKNEEKINPILIKKFNSYLEWIELIYLNKHELISEYAELNVYKKDELLKELNEIKYSDSNEQTENERQEEEENYQFEYKYIDSTKIPSKTSITAISQKEKEYFNNEAVTREKEDDEKIELAIPKFLINQEEEKISGAKRGTIIHLCMKNLDFSKKYELQDIKELINELEKRKIITEKEKESINIRQILQFTKSNIWNEISSAKEVHKEEPFYINIPANKIEETKCTENILAQGIIDLYFIDKDDKLVLLDYKTDFVNQGEEKILIDRHHSQLILYKEALESSLNKKVDRIFIYSTCLGKSISIK